MERKLTREDAGRMSKSCPAENEAVIQSAVTFQGALAHFAKALIVKGESVQLVSEMINLQVSTLPDTFGVSLSQAGVDTGTNHQIKFGLHNLFRNPHAY
jgi:hypothetical protein